MREAKYPSDVLLSRSRFLATATNSLRFYREYFKPESEIFIEKDRKRWHVRFRETTFYVNLDEVVVPNLGFYLEVKARTWSRKDAETKSALVAELIRFLGGRPEEAETDDYVKIVDEMRAG